MRHSSLNKFTENSKYQILSDIYKLILKSEQFTNGMRNNINKSYNERYYIPYPISSTEDGIAQIRELPLRFSWKFLWNLDNIILGYSLLGVDDDDVDQPYNDGSDSSNKDLMESDSRNNIHENGSGLRIERKYMCD